jgi:hypothetical protein
LFLRIDVRLIQDVSSLNLGPLFAESAFKDVLPPDLVLCVYQGSKDGFTVVGIHLEVLIRQRASNALKQNESKVELCVISGTSNSPRERSNSARHTDRLGQLRMCQEVSVVQRHEGQVSVADFLIRCMCR